jgi:hypothetical protein
MVDDRSQLGFLIAALGAAVLAVSVFLPWYGVSITASGAATAQQQLSTVAQQYGNTTFQAGANQLGAEFSSLAGRQLTTVSGHDAVKHISLMLLVLAGLCLVASLLRLAGIPGLIEASGGQVAVAGCVAALFVLYRMVTPPGGQIDLISLSLSTAAIVGGGFLAGSGQGRRRPAESYGSQI